MKVRVKLDQARNMSTHSLVLLSEILVEEGHVPRISYLGRSLQELLDEGVHLGNHVVAHIFATNLRGIVMIT